MVRISEVSFKIRKIARLYDLDYITTTTTTITTGYLKKISGWLANPGGKRLKPIEEISQEELNACLYVSTHLRGLQLQKFIYEIRTSGGHNVRFHRSAPLSKTFAQLLRFSISLKFKNLHLMLVSYTWTYLKSFKTSARNSVQHKKSRP